MRTIVIVALAAACFASIAHAQPCTDALQLQCLPGNHPEIICVTVWVTNCAGTIDALGFDLLFDPNHLEFTGADAVGTLMDPWFVKEVNPVGGTTNRIRVGGFDTTGFGVVADQALIRICFRVTTIYAVYPTLEIDPASLVDDVDGFAVLGCTTPLPVESRVWGAIKTLFQ